VTRAASTSRTRIVRTAGQSPATVIARPNGLSRSRCTGCAVTERFALKTKYFYDEQNLKAFREEYAAMPLHEKAMENRLLAGGVWSWRFFWRLLSCSRVAASSKSVLKHVVPAQRRRTVSPSRSRICFATSRSIASSTVSSWSSESARTFARTLSRSTSTLSIPSSTAPRERYIRPRTPSRTLRYER